MDYNPYSLEGKTILVTGGAGGIGSEVGRVCSKLGARIVLTDIREEALQTAVSSLTEVDAGVHLAIRADLTNSEELNSLVERLPEIDGFVCNAGVMKLVLTQFITEEELMRIQSINLNAPILLTKALLKKKKIRKGGSIVFTEGIRCNSVNPGMVETALIGTFTEEQKEKEKLNYPLRRFAQPEDIAQGIAFLLSDASSFITGTALKIDGGMTLS